MVVTSDGVGPRTANSAAPITNPVSGIGSGFLDEKEESASSPIEDDKKTHSSTGADSSTLNLGKGRRSSDGTLITEKQSKKVEDDHRTLQYDAPTKSADEAPKRHEHSTKLRDLSDSEANIAVGKKRDHWYQLWRPRNAPKKAPTSLDEAKEIPLAKANWLSQMTYSWVTPMMVLGYQRPLQATDLWKMDSTRESGPLSDKFLEAYHKRRALAETYNARLLSEVNPMQPPRRKTIQWWTKSLLSNTLPKDVVPFAGLTPDQKLSRKQKMAAYESEWRHKSGKKEGSLIWALDDVLTDFWTAGFFKVLGDTAQMMTPLLTKQLIKHANALYAAREDGTAEPGVGKGIGLAFGVLLLTIMASVCTHQFFFKSMTVGVMARATLITATYKQVMALTIGERAKHPSGKIMTHLSADISRIDYCAQWFHAIWTAPIQVIVCLILLVVNIGPSALVGMSLFFFMLPLQTWFMKISLKFRQKSMKWTDKRSRILQELLSSMQIIKQFTYEIPFLKRILSIRNNELVGVRSLMFIRAANQALAFSVPVLASVVAFACYAGIGNQLEAAEVFTSLSWFMLLRQPLMFLPRALSSLSDAQSAVERLTPLFEAETADIKVNIDYASPHAIKVTDAAFEWVAGTAPKPEKANKAGKSHDKKEVVEATKPADEKPFSLCDIDLEIPRGSLVAIVGPIGSGKSSLLQALLGDMQHRAGTVAFGGTIGYAQQQAWIQNLTLRENIISFGGRPFDEGDYWRAVKDSALPADLELLPDGDGTEIGERGVNLSGGQKQRINIARVLYRDPDIAFFDDVLSALDAHVGQWVFDNALMGLKRRGKTVVLVTHAVHLLDQVDYIYTMEHGRIAEHGSYEQLMSNKGAFSRLLDEFGGADANSEKEEELEEDAIEEASAEKPQLKHQITEKMMGAAAGSGKLEGRLMVAEERKTGRVGHIVYGEYFKAARALGTGPLVLLCAVLMQGAQISSTLWLTYWQEDKYGKAQGFYMGIYAAIGILQSCFTFLVGVSTGLLCFFASTNLFEMALKRLFYAPMSIFDTTPLGRLMGVLTKDVDTVDNQLADSYRMFILTFANCTGSIIIITVFFHYFIIAVGVVGVGYIYFAMFYRASAREVKRLDSMTRSLLYSHFSETLSGLSTVRAFGEERRFTKDNAFYMDLEDRAYILTAANQRWLAIRLDTTGAFLSFTVAMMAATGVNGLTASQVGLTLTYLTSLVQQLGMVARQSAELENNMNAVERVLHNAQLPEENPYEIAETKPNPDWPANGTITFKDCVLTYRPGLPPALKSISFSVGASERLGVIGRTGAGKSSLTVALYRLVELASGSIEIDGVDISKIGLRDLRSKLAIIPQEPRLFAGTIRSCLDPFEDHDDAYLYDAMRRASLLELKTSSTAKSEEMTPGVEANKFTLDTVLEEEGSNLSVGERSLVSLARALVKNAKITILDEATASIDLLTDQLIQETINRDFSNTTLICIAHRLRTIIGWDRIVVMDGGQIAEIDTPLRLFDNEAGIFRSLCEKSAISRTDIEKAQAQVIEQRGARP